MSESLPVRSVVSVYPKLESDVLFLLMGVLCSLVSIFGFAFGGSSEPMKSSKAPYVVKLRG